MILKDVYKKYYIELYKFGYQLGLSEEESKDIVQDVFLKLNQALKNDQADIKNVKAWLYRVTYRDSISFQKRKENRRKINSEISTHNLYMDMTEQDHKSDTEERRKILQEELTLLAERERIVLLLQFDNLSYQEISEVLGMNINSVGSLISRSRSKLIKNIKMKYHELFK